MKKLLISAVLLSLLLLADSCKQCTTCVKYPEDDVKLCKKDFASDDSYTQAYRQLTYDRYECE